MTETRPVRVLCVDDNAFVLDALRIAFRLSSAAVEYAGDLRDASGLTEAAERLRPDVVLLDVDMPGPDPFAVLADLSRVAPGTRVVMLSGHVRASLIDRAIDAGAWGYLSKHASTERIVDAVRRVADGEFVLGADVEAESWRSGPDPG